MYFYLMIYLILMNFYILIVYSYIDYCIFVIVFLNILYNDLNKFRIL